jgi:hypothetical protein
MRRSMRSLNEEWFLDFGQRTSTYTFTQTGDSWSPHPAEAKGETWFRTIPAAHCRSIGMPSSRPYLPDELVREIRKDA